MHILRKDIFGLFLTHLHTRKHCRSVSMNYIIIEQFSERNHQVLMLTKYKIGPKQSILGISLTNFYDHPLCDQIVRAIFERIKFDFK